MDNSLSATIQSLDDISLAFLTCLIASQHLIIYGSAASLSTLEATIARTATTTFGFTCAVVTCNSSITVDDLSEAIVVDNSFNPKDGIGLDTRQIANIVVTRDLDLASEDVQIQALEIMRQRRVLSHTAIHAAPKQFLFVALLPATDSDLDDDGPEVAQTPRLAPAAMKPASQAPDGRARELIKHINDHFFISHTHISLDATDDNDDDPDADQDSLGPLSPADTASTTSMQPTTSSQPSVIIQPIRNTHSNNPAITPTQITALAAALPTIRTTAELRRYAHDIVTYLRLHRATAGGISAISARHLDTLARILALLHGIAFVTPSLVQLAARKVFAHRVVLATPATERSMQWGSERRAVEEALRGVTSAHVLEDVLETVPCPL